MLKNQVDEQVRAEQVAFMNKKFTEKMEPGKFNKTSLFQEQNRGGP